MKKTKNFLKSFSKKTLILTLGLTIGISISVFAAQRTVKYTPGETLNPNCSPGEVNCSVVLPNSDAYDASSILNRITALENNSSINLNGVTLFSSDTPLRSRLFTMSNQDNYNFYVIISEGMASVTVHKSALKLASEKNDYFYFAVYDQIEVGIKNIVFDGENLKSFYHGNPAYFGIYKVIGIK